MHKSLHKIPSICVCIGLAETAQAAKLAIASCDNGEDFLELRLDMLADPAAGCRIISRINRRHPDSTILATCRRKPSGGQFRGSIREQLAILEDAVKAGAALVDIEIETMNSQPLALNPFTGKAYTMVSYHNFERTPSLQPVMNQLQKYPADLYKLATKVRKPTDNLKLLDICKQYKNLVLVGMSETGSPARLLSPSHGGRFTFAMPDPLSIGRVNRTTTWQAPTAPGQLMATDMHQLYRVKRSKPDMQVFCVIASPVGHSLSPLIHNRAFKSRRVHGIYLPLLVEPGLLGDFFQLARELPITGVSVTIPHKKNVMRHLDSVDQQASGIGAVNTIYLKRGKLVGTNTDVNGIILPLSKQVKLNRSRVLIVGNGGVAIAAIFGLKQQGAEVVITGRNPQRVKRIARRYDVGAIEFSEIRNDYFDVLVQATPVGMSPNVKQNLFPGRIPADVVFDLVYNPLETALLKHASSEGKTVINGVEMFIEQAAEQFRIWTGEEPPREVMRNAVLKRLSS